MTSQLNFDDFRLDQVILEVRYPPSYLHWDRAGAIWTQAVRRWPSLSLTEGKPQQTTFSLGRGQELVASIDRMRLVEIASQDRSLETFADIAQEFFLIVSKTLEITSCTRLGFRQMFVRSFDDSRDAADAVLSTGRVVPPDLPPFGIDPGPSIQPQVVLRWEGKRLGARVELRAEDRRVEFTPPPNVNLEAVRQETKVVVYDVDLYTIGSIDIEQLELREWVRNAIHTIRHRSDGYLHA